MKKLPEVIGSEVGVLQEWQGNLLKDEEFARGLYRKFKEDPLRE